MRLGCIGWWIFYGWLLYQSPLKHISVKQGIICPQLPKSECWDVCEYECFSNECGSYLGTVSFCFCFSAFTPQVNGSIRWLYEESDFFTMILHTWWKWREHMLMMTLWFTYGYNTSTIGITTFADIIYINSSESYRENPKCLSTKMNGEWFNPP